MDERRMEPIIHVRDVSFTYQGQAAPVLNGVSFDIMPGTVTLVCGPTGSGKTTLIRLLNGLIPHFHEGVLTGEVIVDGIVVKDASTARMAQSVGMVFQNPDNQLVSSTCEREIAFGPENLGLPREEIASRLEDAMSMLDLNPIRDTSPNELSGGQKQRVAIAAALALRPKILVFDEPSSNLDPDATHQLFETIAGVNRTLGTTIIIVEHKLELFLELATHVLCVENGCIRIHDDVAGAIERDEFFTMGLQVPVLIKLFKALKDRGLASGPPPVNSTDGIARLRSLLARGGLSA